MIFNVGAASGGSGADNIKYDQSTDTIYIKGTDGGWYKWGVGGLLTHYVYHTGDEITNLTGGWNKFAPSSLASGAANGYNNITITKLDSSMKFLFYLASSGVNEGFFGTANAVDLTGYNKVVVDIIVDPPTRGEGSTTAATNAAIFNLSVGDAYYAVNGVGGTPNATVEFSNKGTSKYLNARGRLELDISTISGSKFIYFEYHGSGNYQGGQFRVFDMWLE